MYKIFCQSWIKISESVNDKKRETHSIIIKFCFKTIYYYYSLFWKVLDNYCGNKCWYSVKIKDAGVCGWDCHVGQSLLAMTKTGMQIHKIRCGCGWYSMWLPHLPLAGSQWQIQR